ncbi:VWA domain-containing protein [Pseudomonas songnenensis]|uniref:VWA domain-containing protein n=1 Tax=Pseudomonas songnenensis TaxID=1176259 RepID=A0ABX9UYC3_9PSED|nr:VWA domain-containing protein [Pseudomonas songnenensis]MCQ4301370.1 VWA domain-containing protein [Pseudomonas songnenensis]RMH98403.1 VWA domain-containing protein [Pseudomonas songnenensis]
MSQLLPHLLRPYWLLILPLLIWLLWRLWHRQLQIGRWQRLLPEVFHAALLTRGRLRHSRLPWLVLGLAWLLAVIALLGPSWQRFEQPSVKRSDPLVVLMELTPSMLAGDVPPTRLQQAKRKLLDLLEKRQDVQTAMVVFAGSAHTVVPLSDDLATTRNLLDALHPALMPEPGQRADLAVAKGLALLEQAGLGRGRMLLIGSSLDEHERGAIKALMQGRDERLLILGVGTEQGAPIAGENGSFLKDDQGAILIPRLDNARLQRLATELGGRYQQARLGDDDLAALGLLDQTGTLQHDEELTRLEAWLDQGHWLLVPLLLLAALAGRRGWLFCLPLLLLQPQAASAFEMDDLWLRRDQQGQRLLEAQQPAEAAERFVDRRWRATARYQAGDYAGAAELFAEGNTAADHYNRGNALARSEALEAAIEAYEQALELQPDLQEAQRNKALVEELLRRRQEQPEPKPEPEQQQEQAEPNEPQPQPQPQPPESGSASAPSPDDAEGEADRAASSAVQPSTSETTAQAPEQDAATALAQHEALPDQERQQAMEQWLRQIPDNPGELLRRKFLYEQRKHQETSR